MFPVLAAFLRSYAPIVMLPVSFTVGLIGYNFEWWLRDNKVTDVESVNDQRKQRQQEELNKLNIDDFDSVYDKNKQKKTIFSE